MNLMSASNASSNRSTGGDVARLIATTLSVGNAFTSGKADGTFEPGGVNFTTRSDALARVLDTTDVTVVAEAGLEGRVRVYTIRSALNGERLATSGLRALRLVEATTFTNADLLSGGDELLGLRRADTGLTSTTSFSARVPNVGFGAFTNSLVATDSEIIRALRVLGASVSNTSDQAVTGVSVGTDSLVFELVADWDVGPEGNALRVGNGVGANSIEAIVSAQRRHGRDVGAVEGRNEERGHSM